MDYKETAKRVIEKFKKSPSNNDNIRYKEIIKTKLLECEDLIYALNNKELIDIDAPVDAYYGVNIKPYLSVKEAQSKVGNYILFDTSFSHISPHNEIMKYMQIVFIIICEVNGVIDPYTGIARHDLIGAILQDEINWSNAFGTQMNLVSDEASLSDDAYATRTLVFQQTTPNGIVRNGRKITGEVRR